MTFYVDKKVSIKHYFFYSILLVLFGILLFILGLKYYEYLFIMYISIIITIIGFIDILLGSFYSNLTFFGNGFMIGKRISGGSGFHDNYNVPISLSCSYTIEKLSAVTVNKKYIKLKGIFTMLKTSNYTNYGYRELFDKKKIVHNVKIPRIYGKENDLIEYLKKMIND